MHPNITDTQNYLQAPSKVIWLRLVCRRGGTLYTYTL